MAVLVEAISVVVRRDAINAKYRGGWSAYVEDAPNVTLCYDDDLARIGFMMPWETEVFINRLTEHGLIFLADNKAQDIAVVDQQVGPLTECDWLEFAKISHGESGGKVSACWLFEGPRTAYGVHFSSKTMNLAVPPGWEFEDSLSHDFTFVPNEEIEGRLQFLRTENGVNVYLDRETGEEVFGGEQP